MKERKQGQGPMQQSGNQIRTVKRSKQHAGQGKSRVKLHAKVQPQPAKSNVKTQTKTDVGQQRKELHKVQVRPKVKHTARPQFRQKQSVPAPDREVSMPVVSLAAELVVPKPESTDNKDVFGGRNAVIEALRSGRPLNKLYVQEGLQGGSLIQILHLAKENGVVVEYVKPERLHALLPEIKHQGVAAIAAPVAFSSLEAILAKARSRGEAPFLLLLDELQDPQNVGALIRTADAAGVHGVLLPVRHSCPLNAVVAKTSAGAVEYVPVVQIGNVTQTLEKLKKQGFWVVGADMAGNICYDADLTGPIVVVVGAEGKGLGRLVRESCDILVRLPMFGGVNSLNAGAAGAVLMYEVVRQRLARNH
jgi:23S rRNA (guanosine2251-2'-O)-methyltransferase